MLKYITPLAALAVGLSFAGAGVSPAQAMTLKPATLVVGSKDVVSVRHKRRHKGRRFVGHFFNGIYFGSHRGRRLRHNRYYNDHHGRFYRGRHLRRFKGYRPGYGRTYDNNGFINEK